MTRRAMRPTLALALGALLSLGLGACGEDGDDGADVTPAGSSAVELTLPEAGAEKCMMVDAEVLAQMDTAFEGTVTSIEDDEVTLEVDRWFKGGDAETVVVTQPSTAVSEPVVQFEQDRTYLVSATDEVVSMCGFSAEKSDDLEAAYDEAFPSAG